MLGLTDSGDSRRADTPGPSCGANIAACGRVRDAGLGFSSEQDMTVSQIRPVLYDAVIFVDRTTRARPLHR